MKNASEQGGVKLKRLKKIFICFFASVCYFCCFNAYSISFDSSLFGTSFLQSQTNKVIKLKDGIIKKEKISTVRYCYPKDLSNINEKYLTVRTVITFSLESTGEVISIVSMESNFRYNSHTERAQCLSTSLGTVKSCEGGVAETFSRRANVKIGCGQSIAHLEFKYKGNVYDNTHYRISCDYKGNIRYG